MFDVFYIGKKPNRFAHEREVKSIVEAQELSRTRYFWIIHYLCDYSEFDFLWEPKPWEAHQRHVYASQWNKDSGTCLCPKSGYTDTQYHAGMIAVRKPCTEHWDHTDVEGFNYSWHPDPTEPPFVYQFGTQWQKTGGPRYVIPGATVVKYVRENRVTKTTVDNNWVIPDNVEIDGFDYTWHPDATEPAYDYQFGTQWQKTGGPRYTMPGATKTKYVEQVKAENIAIAREVYFIDHGNPEADETIKQLEANGCAIKKRTRFISSYKGTLQRVLSCEEQEYVWVCSSVCDYSNFDFSWHPEQWQATMLHVFASNEQKFGDTFLVNVPSFNDRIAKTEVLEWYNTLHFVDDISVPRWPMPKVIGDGNSIVDGVKEHVFDTPLALFTNTTDITVEIPTVSLWREKTRTIVPITKGNSVIVVPRDAKTHISKELYDYPYIDTTCRSLMKDKPLDVVFLSNGEKNAKEHLDHLQHILPLTNNLHVVQNINGRLNAYRKCAELSKTTWFFVAYAKLLIDKNFNWEWQPDRMQKNKHYIFHAYNPVNGLEYGHMAMIALNKKLVLSHPGTGIDFSMEQSHEVVPIRSGIAEYNKDPWMTWRTAFRETLKLIYANSITNNIETSFRIKAWTTIANGDNAEWSLKGAADARDYFDSVSGDFEKIRLSYEWDWLRLYFNELYNLLPPT